MKNISFALTTPQYRDFSKDVTRRFGWWNVKPGQRLMGVEKGMGIPKGETVKKLGELEIISTRHEPLKAITQEDCVREGFPDFTPEDFVNMLLKVHKDKTADSIINRIEFIRIEPCAVCSHELRGGKHPVYGWCCSSSCAQQYYD